MARSITALFIFIFISTTAWAGTPRPEPAPAGYTRILFGSQVIVRTYAKLELGNAYKCQRGERPRGKLIVKAFATDGDIATSTFGNPAQIIDYLSIPGGARAFIKIVTNPDVDFSRIGDKQMARLKPRKKFKRIELWVPSQKRCL